MKPAGLGMWVEGCVNSNNMRDNFSVGQRKYTNVWYSVIVNECKVRSIERSVGK